MTHQDELIFLIDTCKSITGSHAGTAKVLGIPREHVAMWRSGARTCTPEDQALLAGIAGFDPQATLIRATVQKHEGKPKGDLLMKVLGKPSLAIGAALVSAGANAHQIFSAIPSSDHIVKAALWLFTQCALC
jgi:hypothetical protein